MSEFVEECRREWRRLGVPDPVANEMAADLTADLDEAEADGAAPEDVLGNSAFDPRRFAASWATARGVTGPPIPDRPTFWRLPVAVALTVFLGALTVGAGLLLLVGLPGRSFAFAVRRAIAAPGPVRMLPPVPNRIVVPGPLGPFVGTQIGGANTHPLAVLLLIIVIVGVVGLGVLAVLYRKRWSGHGRFPRPGGGRTPSWN